ncbi:GH25 family lysozyme [Spongiactinospora sp. TRM90649]|uniref:glycoside hydrolase family 25 protein n=1 Tax=Spongiactinospora sp. TRM90649 TaxID=3031114 RepID=UPI0023F7B64E|nr:GH25 family lysozyme [Spongiactinospora sp. TRM90649]MDF5758284.1 GH25 family lysozyme [Spongiactinospora sp. TRM90649]
MPRNITARLGTTLRTTTVAGLLAAVTATTGAALAAGQAHAATGPDKARTAPAAAQVQPAALTYGQDVSAYQAEHDWNASPAGFGIVKATEGLTFKDGSFARHWGELNKKGIVRGAYHYGHPGNAPVAEAEHFLSVVNGQPGKAGDLMVLDLETTDGKSAAEVNAWAKSWLSHVKTKTGVAPMFYSGWDFADTHGAGLSEYPLWVAHYGKAQGAVKPPADWKTWTIHQYSDKPIDQNVSNLTPDRLRSLGRPAA